METKTKETRKKRGKKGNGRRETFRQKRCAEENPWKRQTSLEEIRWGGNCQGLEADGVSPNVFENLGRLGESSEKGKEKGPERTSNEPECH